MTFRNIHFIPVFFRGLILCLLYFISETGVSQSKPDTAGSVFSLDQCIRYALSNQPLVRQSEIDEKINEQNIRVAMSGWYPQVNADANLQHYLQLPETFFPDFNNPSGPKIHQAMGVYNTSLIQLSATQSIYTTDLFFAGRASGDLRKQASENLQNTRINTIITISKSFYDVLLTGKQLEILDEAIERLKRAYDDAFHLYQSGVTDRIDYQQALISLNNVKIQRKNAEEVIHAKYAVLRQEMGYPPGKQLLLSYDSASIAKETVADTLEQPDYNNRIEYQLLKTGMKLQNDQVGYYKWSFLPSLSAFYNYDILYQDDKFENLYSNDFPYSYFGLRLSWAIFRGAARLQNLKKASLEFRRMEEGGRSLESQISSEYSQALATYKSNYYALQMADSNIVIAREIYNTVKLQYNQGIKPYIDLLVSETDLRAAQLNRLSALFHVLSGNLDLKKSLGRIN